jgi:hypothetical protein
MNDKICKACNGKGYPNVIGFRVFSHNCCHCDGTGKAKKRAQRGKLK